MQTNARAAAARTHEGGPSQRLTPVQRLRRSVLSCMLFESEHYENGESIADRVRSLCEEVPVEEVAGLAVEARSRFHLRHVPLLLLVSLVERGRGRLVSDTIAAVLQRPDELCELVSLYWRDGRRPLTAQLKKGLAAAFQQFSEHQLAKYSRRHSVVKLRDILFLAHPTPLDSYQETAWSMLADGTLRCSDTWEARLSAGANKRETFESMLADGTLGYLALLRNLRNMIEAGCDPSLVRSAILARKGADRVLPFRFVAAARAATMFERELDAAMQASIDMLPELSGHTILLVDVSGSMTCSLSARSDMTRMIAAASLAAIARCESRQVFSFSNDLVECPPRSGLAGVDAIIGSQDHGGTMLGDAIAKIQARHRHDRLIVVTDEQSHDDVPSPSCDLAYMINVGSYDRGVRVGDGWHRIDGFSESVLSYLAEIES